MEANEKAATPVGNRNINHILKNDNIRKKIKCTEKQRYVSRSTSTRDIWYLSIVYNDRTSLTFEAFLGGHR